MDSTQQATSLYSGPPLLLILAGMILLLVILYFVRKKLYRLDIYLSSKSGRGIGFRESPWHVSGSFILGLLFSLSLFLSSGKWESFNPFSFHGPADASAWQWLGIFLLAAFTGMAVVVAIRSYRLFRARYGTIRSLVILPLMIIYFFAGMYTALFFLTLLALYLVYRFYILFFGRRRGLLTR